MEAVSFGEGLGPVSDEYQMTERDVTGGSKKMGKEMQEKLDQFIESRAFGLLLRDGKGNMVLNATTADISGIRGSGRVERIDIQGPHGKAAARIAYQVKGYVVAEVIIPLKKSISEAQFREAFDSSLKSKKVVEFRAGDENILPSSTNIRRKNNRRH